MSHCQASRGPGRDSSNGISLLKATILLTSLVSSAGAVIYPSNHRFHKFDYHVHNPAHNKARRPLSKRENPIPLIVTNNCPNTLWPGLATQAGEGPDSNGFQLEPGASRNMSVGSTWQGRVWGRTNCTVSGDTATCDTGDCFGLLNCQFGGTVPATLVEFTLSGGVTGRQTFYDISLVDGYNLPMGVVYKPAVNTSNIPPNFVNAACIATAGFLKGSNRTGHYYTNSSYPMPYETVESNKALADWCPWDLQLSPPSKPGDGVYPYPDDTIKRPIFDPCYSACAKSNSPADCCTGKYNDPNVCQKNDFAVAAKAVCPDAYSFAYDDQTSTFIIPSGGGWEVVFCPDGRSTDILSTFGEQLQTLASSGVVTEGLTTTAMNLSYIKAQSSAGAAPGLAALSGAHVVFVAVVVLLLLALA